MFFEGHEIHGIHLNPETVVAFLVSTSAVDFCESSGRLGTQRSHSHGHRDDVMCGAVRERLMSKQSIMQQVWATVE